MQIILKDRVWLLPHTEVYIFRIEHIPTTEESNEININEIKAARSIEGK